MEVLWLEHSGIFLGGLVTLLECGFFGGTDWVRRWGGDCSPVNFGVWS